MAATHGKKARYCGILGSGCGTAGRQKWVWHWTGTHQCSCSPGHDGLDVHAYLPRPLGTGGLGVDSDPKSSRARVVEGDLQVKHCLDHSHGH